LDVDGAAETLYFRGLLAWNDTLWGYGFGGGTTAVNQDRGEYVRASKPGQPDVIPPEAYFIAGRRAVPITGMAALGAGGIVVAKRASSYLISGADAETYRIDPLDEYHGCLSDRLIAATSGAVWLWGLQGPRATTGGATVFAGQVLALDEPQPATLPAPGRSDHAFCLYDPRRELLEFFWPDWVTPGTETLVYTVSLRDPQQIRWTYGTRGRLLSCARLVITGKETPPPITAYGDFTAQADAGIDAPPSGRKATLTWDNLGGYVGNESYNLYAKPTGGSWALLTTVAHNNAASQSVTVGGLTPLQGYTFAIQGTRGGAVPTGYEGANPDTWSAGTAALSKTTLNTGCGTPTITSAVWSRTASNAAKVTVVFTLADTTGPFVFQQSPDGAAWSDVATYDVTFPRSVDFTHGTAEDGTLVYFRIYPKRGAILGTPSASVNRYLTVVDDYAVVVAGRTDADYFVLCMVQAALTPTFVVEVQHSADGAAWSAFVSQTKAGTSGTASAIIVDAAAGPWMNAAGGTTYIRHRTKQTAFGVTDVSPWAATVNVVRSASAAPAAVTPNATPPAGSGTGYDAYNGFAFTYTGGTAGTKVFVTGGATIITPLAACTPVLNPGNAYNSLYVRYYMDGGIGSIVSYFVWVLDIATTRIQYSGQLVTTVPKLI
jgi:hypothetical protein